MGTWLWAPLSKEYGPLSCRSDHKVTRLWTGIRLTLVSGADIFLLASLGQSCYLSTYLVLPLRIRESGVIPHFLNTCLARSSWRCVLASSSLFTYLFQWRQFDTIHTRNWNITPTPNPTSLHAAWDSASLLVGVLRLCTSSSQMMEVT
jgi:hypothetical protein